VWLLRVLPHLCLCITALLLPCCTAAALFNVLLLRCWPAEELKLLYVAITRAKSNLVIFESDQARTTLLLPAQVRPGQQACPS
jgi:hypothetical protein